MILDTCALLWLSAGDKKLSREARKAINEAPAIYVCSISAFEVTLKVSQGKLQLPSAPLEWFEEVVEHHSLTVLSLDYELCIHAAQLPPIHEDPCDRFIIAAAKLHDLEVVTKDERFEQYGVVVVS